MHVDESNRAVTESFVNTTCNPGKNIMEEGVENARDPELLCDMDCVDVHAYGFSSPLLPDVPGSKTISYSVMQPAQIAQSQF